MRGPGLTRPIDFYATLPHYVDHLEPIWRALDPAERGTFWYHDLARARLDAWEIPGRQGKPRGPRRLLVVAGASDALVNRAHPAALVEHGAGQAYDVDDPGWSGGSQRHTVVLFLCPNEVAAGRNRQAYPAAAAEVVGSPRVDALMEAAARRGEHPPAVALSFHWMGTGKAPEAGWALPHYEHGLGAAVEQLRAGGLEVLGHGHPRAARHLRRMWVGMGVEWVERFDEVVARADCYAADNTSTLYEAAACGIPVVVLNCPAYRRDVDLWPRFWRCADVGVQVDGPAALAGAVRTALEDPPAIAARRAEVLAEVYPLRDGKAPARAAHALIATAESLACTP